MVKLIAGSKKNDRRLDSRPPKIPKTTRELIYSFLLPKQSLNHFNHPKTHPKNSKNHPKNHFNHPKNRPKTASDLLGMGSLKRSQSTEASGNLDGEEIKKLEPLEQKGGFLRYFFKNGTILCVCFFKGFFVFFFFVSKGEMYYFLLK